jgi:hypothetical protein
MKEFRQYVDQLDLLIRRTGSRTAVDRKLKRDVRAALNGQPGEELRRLVTVDDQRTAGAFFTGSSLAKRAAATILSTVGNGSIIYDPACGAGDLLLACANRFSICSTLQKTVAKWGRQLRGRDLHPEFVQAARYRLLLAALSRRPYAGDFDELLETSFFPNLKTACGIAEVDAYKQASHILINPPYTLSQAPRDCEWAAGAVSDAALFLDSCLGSVRAGTRIVAILPDVLRSGARYAKWRGRVLSRAEVKSIRLEGQFDRWADVDVFLLDLIAKPGTAGRTGPWKGPRRSSQILADEFDVSVGAVVPYRDKKYGRPYRYLHARGATPWVALRKLPETRRFAGTVHEPPFLVVRRTSRLGDKHRAIATVIGGAGAVAVENHLLVLKPKDGTLASCRALMKVLQSPETDRWLNQRIRCRHLTVAAMRSFPWSGSGRNG